MSGGIVRNQGGGVENRVAELERKQRDVYSKAEVDAFRIVNSAYAQYATYTGIGTIPYDDTIPQSSEGTEILSVVITPSTVTSKLLILVDGNFSANAAKQVAGALFKGGTANALAAKVVTVPLNGYFMPFSLLHQYTPGVTTAQTISVRVGSESATAYINGQSTTRVLGGAKRWTISVTEIQA